MVIYIVLSSFRVESKEMGAKREKREFTPEEINFAHRFGAFLYTLDRAVFPATPFKRIGLVKGRKANKGQISYFAPPEDRYAVGGYNLPTFFLKETRKKVWEIRPKPVYASRQVRSLDEVIISIAAHEVRHRLQHLEPTLRRFRPESAEAVREEWLKALLKRAGAFCTLVDDLCVNEFDAKVVEYIVIQALQHGAVIQEIAQLIRQQAP
jgi:hypothetical protein